MCLVTKKLVKLTKYASEELNIRYHKNSTSCLASAIVIPTTSFSIISAAGRRNIAATGAMYMRRFIELSFSLRHQPKHTIISNRITCRKCSDFKWLSLKKSDTLQRRAKSLAGLS